MRRVRCPQCGASSPDSSFQVVEPYRAAGLSGLIGFDDDGLMVVEGIDRGDPSSFGPPELVCCECGYQWVTSLRVGSRT